jgi:phosphoribosylglycinamide formyltransferase 2
MNREGIRRLAAEQLGLPTSPYRFADTLDALQAAIEGDKTKRGVGYPCVVKPVMSSSGKGQTVVRTAADIAGAWQYAQSAARVRGSRVIVEGYIDFEYEITLITVRAVDESGTVVTQFCEPIGHRQVNGDYVESWQPQAMSERALATSREIASKVTAELGGVGVFAVELFVRGDTVWFSEVSPRPHDTGMVTMCTQAQSEFELHARAILALPVDVSLRNPGASAVIYGGVEARGIKYDDIAHALAVPQSDLRLFGKPDAYRKRRMGAALATGPDIETARARAIECARRVKPHA